MEEKSNYPPQQNVYPGINQQPPYNPGYHQQPITVTAQPQITTSHVHLVENRYVTTEGASAWSSGLCDCCQDPVGCLAVCCCPICYNCYLSDKLGEFVCLPICVPNYMTALRTMMRTKHNIPGGVMSDCCTSCWCPCCVATQMSRHHDFIRRQPIVQ